MFQKTCKQCGTVFKTTRYPTVFCSQSCYFKFKRAEANKKRLEQIQTYDKSLGAFLKDGYIYFHKTCANCGREYITRFINGKERKSKNPSNTATELRSFSGMHFSVLKSFDVHFLVKRDRRTYPPESFLNPMA